MLSITGDARETSGRLTGEPVGRPGKGGKCMSRDENSIGKNIKRIREAAGMTQENSAIFSEVTSS